MTKDVEHLEKNVPKVDQVLVLETSIEKINDSLKYLSMLNIPTVKEIDLGTLVRICRVRHNLEQKDIEKRVNVSRQLVADIENNFQIPLAGKLIELCKIFGPGFLAIMEERNFFQKERNLLKEKKSK